MNFIRKLTRQPNTKENIEAEQKNSTTISHNGNYKIETNSNNDLQVYILNTRTREYIPLSNYLPEGYKFSVSGENRNYKNTCNHQEKTIYLDIRNINNPFFIVYVLHEIAHAKYDDLEIDEEAKNIYRKLDTKATSESEIQQEEYLIQAYTKYVEKRERDAWINSLRIAKELLDFTDIRNTITLEEFEKYILRKYKTYIEALVWHLDVNFINKEIYRTTEDGYEEDIKLEIDPKYKNGLILYINTIFAINTQKIKDAILDFWEEGIA